MSSKNNDCSTIGNVPDIVEMSFAQMEGQSYKCGTKGHLSNTYAKNVLKGQCNMDEMKMQNVQLMQASKVTMSTINDQSTVTGTIPTWLKYPRHHQSRGKRTILAGPADPQEWNHLYPQLCANQQAHV